MSGPQGEFRRDPPGAGGARALARAGAAAGALLFALLSLSPQKRQRSPAGAKTMPCQSPPTEGTPGTRTARIKLDPACAGATNRVRTPCPKRRHHSPPAMAKPSRQRFPLLQRRVQPATGGVSRRCLSPPGRVSTRPAGRGWNEGTGKAGAAAGCFIHLSCRHKKDGRPPGRDRPITAN